MCVKPPFGGPKHVLKYLARYTHRVAISNGRLISVENASFDSAGVIPSTAVKIKETELGAVEFIRRFLLHVLPSGFVKIRHFGFLSNRSRKQSIERCRALLPAFRGPKPIERSREPVRCPVCHIGAMRIIGKRTTKPRYEARDGINAPPARRFGMRYCRQFAVLT